jgi:hypothetical protein
VTRSVWVVLPAAYGRWVEAVNTTFVGIDETLVASGLGILISSTVLEIFAKNASKIEL